MDDRQVWMLIGGSLLLVAVIGAVGFFVGRETDSEAEPQAPSEITIDLGEGGSVDATDADAASASAGGRGATEDNGGGGAAGTGSGGGSAAPSAWDSPGHEVVGVDRKVAILDKPGGRTVRHVGRRTEFGGPRVMWVVERRGDWLGVLAPELGNGRIGWLRNDPRRLRFGVTPYSIDVDLSDRLVKLSRGGRVIRRVVVSVGRFGSNTPAGRFAVTDVIERGLDPVYGCCAIALSARQPNLPAGWIGGDRIAIHGWAGSVGDSASGGCLRASNGDVRWLTRHIQLGAPVFVRA